MKPMKSEIFYSDTILQNYCLNKIYLRTQFYIKETIKTVIYCFVEVLWVSFLAGSCRKSGWYVVKAVRISSVRCWFVRLARCFDFATFITECSYPQQYLVLKNEMSRTLAFFNSGSFTSGICSQNSIVDWNLLIVFRPRSSCNSISFISTAHDFVTRGSRIRHPSLTTSTMTILKRKAEYGFSFRMATNLAEKLSSSPCN